MINCCDSKDRGLLCFVKSLTHSSKIYEIDILDITMEGEDCDRQDKTDKKSS